jgi:ABC-type dipeptide/oligopeptide/nickel transport system permease subunit
MNMIKELAAYLWEHKLWWLIPPVVVFILFGALIAFSTASPISPFIYMLF